MATKKTNPRTTGIKKNQVKKASLKVVSLFAGAGGLDIAFCETGYVEELFSTDFQPVFLQTVINNLPNHFPAVRHSHLVADARKLTGEEIRELIPGPIDFVIGGPPCDDFTTFGLKRGMAGEKGPIIFDFARLVGELRPKAFLFENVPNLLAMWRDGFTELLNRLSGHGYSVEHKTLAACDFGAPTLRQRLLVVGFRADLGITNYSFPSRTHGPLGHPDLFGQKIDTLPFVTVGETLADLPDVKNPDAARHLNHTGRFHRPETIQHMMTVPEGTSISKSYRYRPALSGLSRSLTAGTDNSTKSYIHPIYHREMSVREYARLQVFPDTWDFSGTHHNGIKQVANAVPIPLGRALATSLVKTLTTDHSP
jgi:DNA (cytosine-5)-methyltransferase 1